MLDDEDVRVVAQCEEGFCVAAVGERGDDLVGVDVANDDHDELLMLGVGAHDMWHSDEASCEEACSEGQRLVGTRDKVHWSGLASHQ